MQTGAKTSETNRESASNSRTDVAGADRTAVVEDIAYRGLLGRKGRCRTNTPRQLRGDSRKEAERGKQRLEAHRAGQKVRGGGTGSRGSKPARDSELGAPLKCRDAGQIYTALEALARISDLVAFADGRAFFS